MFRLFWGEEKYKDFPQVYCKIDGKVQDEKCRYPILKMTNWNKPEAYINKLPQVLLMAGIHGNETTGTYSMVELAEYVKVNYSGFKHMLNSRLIIILPFVNPSGFSHTNREEIQGKNN